MKLILFIFSIFLIQMNGITQKSFSVKIKVDVLGKKHETIRYYHPISGAYEIYPKKVAFQKSILKKLPRFLFIQPTQLLNDSANFIQANSLRYYADPSELIYVNWKMGSDTSNYLRLDSFASVSQTLRDKKYQKCVEAYFNPFFISKYEITNGEYREFVDWVKDSIIREAVYNSPLLDDELAGKMLIHPDVYFDSQTLRWKEFDPSERAKNRLLFDFKQEYNYLKLIDNDSLIAKAVENLYLNPNRRFYKRREIDVSQLTYRTYTFDSTGYDEIAQNPNYLTHLNFDKHGVLQLPKDSVHLKNVQTINIYPDTLSWLKLDSYYPSNDPKPNMYFWHPAFDNYPVVGINWYQAMAFLHWKQKKLDREHPEIAALFEYDLPNAMEYEWAISNATDGMKQEIIQDNQLITNLIINKHSIYHQSISYNHNHQTTEKFFIPYDVNNLKVHKKQLAQFAKKIKRAEKQGYFEDNSKTLMRAQLNYLNNGILFLSNNVSEWMDEDYADNYNKLLEAYINYNCYSNPGYCENQRNIDQNLIRTNDTNGKLISGSNWYDERYGIIQTINYDGLYAKTFQSPDSSFATVGFRCVLRLK